MNSVVLMSIFVFVLINVLEFADAFCESPATLMMFGLFSNKESPGELLSWIV